MELSPVLSTKEKAESFSGKFDHNEAPSGSPPRTQFGGNNGAVNLLQFSRKRSSWAFFPSLLSVTIVSLAVTYWVLRCFHGLSSGPRADAFFRALAAGGGEECFWAQDHSSDEGEEELQSWGGTDYFQWHPVLSPGEVGIWSTRAPAPGGPLAMHRGHPSTQPQEMNLPFPNGRDTAASAIPGTSGHPQPMIRAYQHSIAAGQVPENGRQQPVPAAGRTSAEALDGENEDSDSHLWYGRGMSESAKEQAMHVLEWMQRNADICANLLPSLSPEQGLVLAYTMLQVLTLDLAAVSLVPQELEIQRRKAGEALENLVSQALTYGRANENLAQVRKDLFAMERLVRVVKMPRPCTEDPFSPKRKFKTLTLLAAIRTVGKYSTKVLTHIASHAKRSSKEVLEMVVKSQHRILTALWEEHKYHIVRDKLHRFYAVCCQKKVGAWLLIPLSEIKRTHEPIPAYKVLLRRLDMAVENAGGEVLTSALTAGTDQKGTARVGCRDAPSAERSTSARDEAHEPMPSYGRNGDSRSQGQMGMLSQQRAPPGPSMQRSARTVHGGFERTYQDGQQPGFQPPATRSSGVQSREGFDMFISGSPSRPCTLYSSFPRMPAPMSPPQTLAGQPDLRTSDRFSLGLPSRGALPSREFPRMPPLSSSHRIGPSAAFPVSLPPPRSESRLGLVDFALTPAAPSDQGNFYSLFQGGLGVPPWLSLGSVNWHARAQEESQDSAEPQDSVQPKKNPYSDS